MSYKFIFYIQTILYFIFTFLGPVLDLENKIIPLVPFLIAIALTTYLFINRSKLKSIKEPLKLNNAFFLLFWGILFLIKNTVSLLVLCSYFFVAIIIYLILILITIKQTKKS